MKYVYGPVPSKRLGQSLGIDTIPLKTCNWNCVYCQLGRTVPLTNKRREYYPRQEILEEISEALRSHKTGDIDWITFVGSGEPTLHASIGWLIRQVKEEISNIPVAVITNGSLLYLPKVRQELLAADAVLPSLDAGTAKLYRQINRPHGKISFKRHVEGLASFKNEFEGKLWIEVMLVRGLNDTEEALRNIAAALQRIKPDEVHINSPTRPPVETWVQPADADGFTRANSIFGEHAKVVSSVEGIFQVEESESIVGAIIEIIKRHPISEDDLLRTLDNYPPEKVSETLAALQISGLVQVVERNGIHFWSAARSNFPTETQSQATSPEHLKRHSRSVQKDKNSHSRIIV